jgi:SAM-dependent methyltransferase
VLEAAVGTGRLLVPLLVAGLDVDGVDSSTEMLAYCRRNCAAAGLDPTLYCGALETMALPMRYRAIVITFGSFMLLCGPGEATAALDRIRHHLLPGGRLFLDVDAPAVQVSARAGTSRRVAHGPDGSTLVLVDELTGEGTTDRIERHVLTSEKSVAGRVVAREVQDFLLRRYERAELTSMLSDAGFVNVEVWADYTEGADAGTAKHWLCLSARLPA